MPIKIKFGKLYAHGTLMRFSFFFIYLFIIYFILLRFGSNCTCTKNNVVVLPTAHANLHDFSNKCKFFF